MFRNNHRYLSLHKKTADRRYRLLTLVFKSTFSVTTSAFSTTKCEFKCRIRARVKPPKQRRREKGSGRKARQGGPLSARLSYSEARGALGWISGSASPEYEKHDSPSLSRALDPQHGLGNFEWTPRQKEAENYDDAIIIILFYCFFFFF
ncbi:hypothetical protein SRHO_G00137510 [Serrasalmus rhombeus]